MSAAPETSASSVMTQLRQIIAADPLEGWESAWNQRVTPWDVGYVQPPLKDLVESGSLDLPRQGRALVPGCGRGCDALFIASALGLDVLAVDISATAISTANDLLESKAVAAPGKVTFQVGDFFALGQTEQELFDLVYDYTFFVSLPPTRRTEWGRQMSKLVKPGGFLITLIFPLDPPQDYGPPFYVRPEHYVAPLGDSWVKVLDEVPRKSSDSHNGRERLVVWRKE